MATATYEPVRPSRLQRAIRKLPGLRRIHRSSDVEEGFVPPRPLRENTLLLPPGSAQAALDGRQIDLKADLDESGRVTRVELLAPKNEEIVTLASYAAADWRFVPAEVSDTAVPSQIIIHFHFHVDPR